MGLPRRIDSRHSGSDRAVREARRNTTTRRFCARRFGRIIKDRCLVHSSVPEPLGGDAFPPHPPFDGFVGEIVHPRADARDVVAILLPSRGRAEAALATARSARATASAPEQLRLVVGVEPAEVREYRDVFGDDASWIQVLDCGGSYVRAIRELHRSTTAAIYGLCADDFVFETPGWDNRIRRAVADLPERLGLVYADDGMQRERIATAPFLTAEWIACVADILPGNYEHMFCDTEVTDIARLAGLLRFLPSVRITHRHYTVWQAAFDATYERSSRTMAAGRAEFERREGERQRLAARLARASRAPTLSILIPVLVQRAGLLDELLAGLRRQVEALPDPSIIEVLVEPDAGERSTAAKQRSLLARARGTWVAFVEGDDVVADDAVAVILRALEQDPDGVTSDRLTTPNAVASGASNRIFAIRRSIAAAVARKDVTGREDFKWSGVMSPFLKREVKIDRVVFHHRIEPTTRTSRPPVASRIVHHGPSRRRSAPGLPSPAQQLLLTAALCRNDLALGAWDEWVSEIGPEQADSASTDLFPLVWWNLQHLGASGIEVNSLKPYYWRSWATNHERIQLAAGATGAFQKAGIPTLLIKGVALASRHYEKPELRPTRDVDLLIPELFAEEARRFLISTGWRPMENFPGAPFSRMGSGSRIERGACSPFTGMRFTKAYGLQPMTASGPARKKRRSVERRRTFSHRRTRCCTSAPTVCGGPTPLRSTGWRM